MTTYKPTPRPPLRIVMAMRFELIDTISAEEADCEHAHAGCPECSDHDHVMDFVIRLTEANKCFTVFSLCELDPVVGWYEGCWDTEGTGADVMGPLLACLNDFITHPKVGRVQWRFFDGDLDDEAPDAVLGDGESVNVPVDVQAWTQKALAWCAG